jgi:hypothetical protein
MRKQLLALAILMLGSFLDLAAQSAQQATIISHTTVQCSTKNKDKKKSTTTATSVPFTDPLPNFQI